MLGRGPPTPGIADPRNIGTEEIVGGVPAIPAPAGSLIRGTGAVAANRHPPASVLQKARSDSSKQQFELAGWPKWTACGGEALGPRPWQPTTMAACLFLRTPTA